jgi:hypothetical protein
MERTFKVLSGTLVTAGGDGAALGDIPASVFGLTYIEESSPLIDEELNMFITCPVMNGGSIVVKSNTEVPADLAGGTYRITVKGY